MNIQKALSEYLDRPGQTQDKLAADSGVPQAVISRVANGKQAGVHSKTLFKLMPFLSPSESTDEQSEPPEAAQERLGKTGQGQY